MVTLPCLPKLLIKPSHQRLLIRLLQPLKRWKQLPLLRLLTFRRHQLRMWPLFISQPQLIVAPNVFKWELMFLTRALLALGSLRVMKMVALLADNVTHQVRPNNKWKFYWTLNLNGFNPGLSKNVLVRWSNQWRNDCWWSGCKLHCCTFSRIKIFSFQNYAWNNI